MLHVIIQRQIVFHQAIIVHDHLGIIVMQYFIRILLVDFVVSIVIPILMILDL